MPDRTEEVDEDVFNPFKSPPRLMAAMAQAAMPVPLDRLGGVVTWTDADHQALERKYGGRVGIELARHPGGRWEARIRAGKSRIVPEPKQ